MCSEKIKHGKVMVSLLKMPYQHLLHLKALETRGDLLLKQNTEISLLKMNLYDLSPEKVFVVVSIQINLHDPSPSRAFLVTLYVNKSP
jgi:hypothetical protein